MEIRLPNWEFLLPFDEYDEEELEANGDIWRPCPSFPGHDASFNGWVRSWVMPGHKVNGYYFEGKRVNSPDGVVKNKTRGQLVADAFLVPREPLWQLRYRDGDNLNASVPNLSYEPHHDRAIRNLALAKHSAERKSHCVHNHKLTDESVRTKPDGTRMCLVCSRAHSSMQFERKKLQRKGLDASHVTFEYVLKRKGVYFAEPE